MSEPLIQDYDVCENCGEPAEYYDTDGIPLCRKCIVELENDSN